MAQEISENYSEYKSKYDRYLRNIVNDIMRENDNVKKALFVAVDLHTGQTRQGINNLPYITHPIQVYDMVKRCIGNRKISDNDSDRDVLLSAALLHDGLEDYKKADVKAGKLDHELAREQAIDVIKSKYTDKKFADKVVKLILEITNPVQFTDEEGKEITKTEWQINHIPQTSDQAKLLKICDKTVNIVSDINEVPKDSTYATEYKYIEKQTSVVEAAMKGKNEISLKYVPSISTAYKIHNLAAESCKYILQNMESCGKPFPPTKPVAFIHLSDITTQLFTRTNREYY